MKGKSEAENKIRRAARSRAKIFGTEERPRLSVFRSNTSMFAQIIDDSKGATIVSFSTSELGPKKMKKAEAAFAAGEGLAKKAKEKGLAKVVFDRHGYRYHGRVRAFAEGARKGGLEF